MTTIDRRAAEDARSRNVMIDLLAFFCLVCRLGFPGNLGKMFSESLTLLLDYASSFLQLILILLASGDSLLEIKLLDIKKKHLPIYALMIAVFLISYLGAASKTAMISTYFRFTLTALFGVWLADHYEPERLMDMLYGGFVVFLGVNLLMMTVFRGHGYYFDEEGRYLFRGITERKNNIGEELAHGLALQGAIFMVKRDHKKPLPRFFYAVALGQVFMLIASQAIGSLLTAAVSVVYLLVFERLLGARGRFQWGILYAIVSLGFLFIALTILPVFAPFLESLGKDATLSNRTYIWEGVIQFMQESHTFTGYGLFLFWNDTSALRSLQYHFHRNSWFRSMTFGSHNVLLELWLDIGLLGIAAYLLTMIYCFNRPRKMSEDQYQLCSAIMFPLMIRGLTERAFSNANYSTLFLFLVLSIACNSSAKRQINRLRPLRPAASEGLNTPGK